MTIPWRNQGREIVALAVYAPNTQKENEEFWRSLEQVVLHWESSKPDIMLGDFNLVEEAVDRLPRHEDHEGAVDALRNLKDKLNLHNGWRSSNSDSIQYSYLQTQTGSQSRIDRMYANKWLLENSKNWTLNPVVWLQQITE